MKRTKMRPGMLVQQVCYVAWRHRIVWRLVWIGNTIGFAKVIRRNQSGLMVHRVVPLRELQPLRRGEPTENHIL